MSHTDQISRNQLIEDLDTVATILSNHGFDDEAHKLENMAHVINREQDDRVATRYAITKLCKTKGLFAEKLYHIDDEDTWDDGWQCMTHIDSILTKWTNRLVNG